MLARTDSVDQLVVGLGLKVPVVPLGRPLTLRPAAPAKPPEGLIVTVNVVERPRATVLLDGETLSEKSAAGGEPEIRAATSVRMPGRVE